MRVVIIDVFKYSGKYCLYYDYPGCKKIIKDSVKAIHKWNHPVKLDFTDVILITPEFSEAMLRDLFQTLGYKKPKKFVSWINGNELVTAVCESSLLHVDTWHRNKRYRHAVELLESNVI